MQILDVRPKDIHVIIEHALEDLDKLHLFLSSSNMKYNSEAEPELAEVAKFMTDDFYPKLTLLLEQVRKDYGT
jgi:hypothetical protein